MAELKQRIKHSDTLVITISEDDLYQILYRLKYQDRLHNVHPDLSKPARESLEKVYGKSIPYIEEIY